MPLNLAGFFGITWRTVAAALVTGGILHILTTLVLARVGATTPYSRLAAGLPANQFKVMPVVTAQTQILPFQAPDMLHAVCPFDARLGPVSVKASLPGAGWVFGLFTAQGENFYSVLGQEGRRTDIGLILMPSGDEFVPLPRELTTPQALLQIPLPSKTGLMMITAPLAGFAFRAEAEAELRNAACALRQRQ